MNLNYKAIYWGLESIVYEIYTRYLLHPQYTNNTPHELPGKLIVSLTSYQPRFPMLDLTIKTLLSQSIKPDLLVLWIAHDDRDALPKKVRLLEEKFKHFEIRYCHDLKSYKKIIPTLNNYPDAFIVTADDDIFYSKRWLEKLCKQWRGSYKEIIAHRVHEVIFNADGTLAPYNKWIHNINCHSEDSILFPTSGAGVLYPPNSLHCDTTSEVTFKKVCPKADDLWLFWMSVMNQSSIIPTKGKFNLIVWRGTKEHGLAWDNMINGDGNDSQIINLQNHYGNIKKPQNINQ